MNNKIALGIIGVLVVAGGFLLISNQSKVNNGKMQPESTTTQTSPAVQTSGVASGAAQGANKEVVTITLTSEGFSPATVTVKAGTVVSWINKSGGLATVNSDPHPTHLTYPPLNVGQFKDGSSVQLTFDKPGTFKYHNHLNPSQTGTVVVE